MRWLQSVEKSCKNFRNYRFTWKIADQCYIVYSKQLFIWPPLNSHLRVHSQSIWPNDAVILFL